LRRWARLLRTIAAAEAGLRLVLITIENPEYVSDVCAHFTRSGFQAQQVSTEAIEVRRDDAPTAHQERLEVDLHLRVWEAMNPSKPVKLVR
jgi:hypothetical protein